MNQYFERMEKLANKTDYPQRIRFMLQDVIELRKNRWIPRKAISAEGPMPIAQVNVLSILYYTFLFYVNIFINWKRF